MSDIISQCQRYQKHLEADIAAGRKWEYRNPTKYTKERFDNAVSSGKRACNCALLARWAIKDAGLVPANLGTWYGEKNGNIHWSRETRNTILKTFDLIHISNRRTAGDLIKNGTLQPGDIVTYVDIRHTNVYAGGGKWYDAGHAYCSGSGDGAIFKSWYGSGKHLGQKVGNILRVKAEYRSGSAAGDKATTGTVKRQYVVQAGAFAEKKNAEKLIEKVKAAGFSAILKTETYQYKVQCGVFNEKDNAEKMIRDLQAAGFSAILKIK